jgi:hypothetical protein
MAFDVQRVIAAFQAGQQIKRQKEQKAQEAEDRKLEIEKRGLELKTLKLGEKERARKEAMEQAQMMQGQPAQETPSASVGMPGLMPMAAWPPTELPLPPVNIPGVMGPDVQVQPQSMQDILRQQRAAKTFESGLKREENTITIPAIPSLGITQPMQVDKSVADNLLTQAGSNVRQEDQQAATKSENEANRTAAANLQTQRDTAAAKRAQTAANSRIQAAQAAGLRGDLNPKQMSVALQLANSLKGHPAYVDMQDIATGLDSVTVGLSQKNGLGDITAINGFQRMVDPGATVREGDVALVQSASALAERILSEFPIEKLRAGAKLPDATRQQMLDAAKQLYERRAKNYNDAVGGQYRQLANGAGIPFEYIGQDFATKNSPKGTEANANPYK